MKVIYLIAGIFIGMLLGFEIKQCPTLKYINQCIDELTTCQASLDDPHHCISVVVEMLEGKDEPNNKQ